MNTKEAQEAINKMAEEVKTLNDNVLFWEQVTRVEDNMLQVVNIIERKLKAYESALLEINKMTDSPEIKALIKETVGL